MSKHGSSEVTVTLDDAPGGTPRVITPYVDSIGGISVENLSEMTMPFGGSSEVHTPTGVTRTPDIEIGGRYDDTATVGPKAVFFTAATQALDKAVGSVGRVLAIQVATGLTFTITVHVVQTTAVLTNGQLTGYKALLRQAGAGVWS